MDNENGIKPIVLGVLLGLLVVTAPNWLFGPHAAASYDAPWVYPGDRAH